MIRELQILDAKNTCVPWWPQVAWLKRKKSIQFEPGLNILFGPNGSGKSTVLKGLARMLCCEQGGVQLVTSHALHELVDYKGGVRDGLHVVQDGSPVFYRSPNEAVGLIGGAFDDDFFSEGVFATMNKGSAGQTSLQRLNPALAHIFEPDKHPIPAATWKTSPHRYEDANYDTPKDSQQKAQARAFFDGLFVATEGVVPTCPAVLLDEPTVNLALPLENRFWVKVSQVAKDHGVQVIVATQSVFALFVPSAHYIETEAGYIETCRKGVLAYFDHAKAAYPEVG